jgi:hypothetical protein
MKKIEGERGEREREAEGLVEGVGASVTFENKTDAKK